MSYAERYDLRAAELEVSRLAETNVLLRTENRALRADVRALEKMLDIYKK